MTSPANASATAQALLDATPRARCPACNELLALLLVPEWDDRPRLCQVDPDGPMRLAAGADHRAHAVVCFNGPKVPGSPTFVAHWARCTPTACSPSRWGPAPSSCSTTRRPVTAGPCRCATATGLPGRCSCAAC